jgi:hypothetical protein
LRNDVYFYSADADKSVRSGQIEVDIDIDQSFNFLTLLYKPGNEVFGALLGDFKAEAAGIGPAVMWIPPQYEGKVAFVAKWINEYHAENRLEGDHVFVSFMASLD